MNSDGLDGTNLENDLIGTHLINVDFDQLNLQDLENKFGKQVLKS